MSTSQTQYQLISSRLYRYLDLKIHGETAAKSVSKIKTETRRYMYRALLGLHWLLWLSRSALVPVPW